MDSDMYYTDLVAYTVHHTDLVANLVHCKDLVANPWYHTALVANPVQTVWTVFSRWEESALGEKKLTGQEI